MGKHRKVEGRVTPTNPVGLGSDGNGPISNETAGNSAVKDAWLIDAAYDKKKEENSDD